MGKGVRGRRGVAKAGKETKVKLATGTETIRFDKKKSQQNRVQSAAKAKRINETSKTQRVSGRAKTRANTQKKVHGRTDEAKKKSLAGAKRNRRYAAEALATVLPGGAAASTAAKAKKAVKAGKYLAAAGRGSLKAGAKRVARDTAKKVARQGIKKSAGVAAKAGKAVGKYVAKTKTQGAINKAATAAATRRV